LFRLSPSSPSSSGVLGVHDGSEAPWPGGRALACFWYDDSPRLSFQMALHNGEFEADAEAIPTIGFLSTHPSGWVNTNGTSIIVANGVFRWGSATSNLTGCFVNLLGESSSISQQIDDLKFGDTSGGTRPHLYQVRFQAASGYGNNRGSAGRGFKGVLTPPPL
jgi:hypothetical protein